MVELSNLTLGYNEKKIITNFSFKFEVGKLYAISGPSGIGKTTLLNAIGGILKPLEGNIYYNMPMNLSKDVTFVYQDTSLIDSLTVLQNIKLMLILAGVKFKKTAILEVLDKLNVLEYLNTKIKLLSGGERQRINIAIAILRDSKIILCDEPDSSLDEDNIRKIMKILKELALTKLVVFTSHKQKALEYADEIISPNSSNESYELTAKYKGYHKINIKAFLYIYFKGLKGKVVSFIFSLIIFSLMIFVSSYFYSLGHYDKSKSLINELNENEGTSLLIKARTDTLKENNVEYEEVEKLEDVMPQLDILYMTRVQRERFFNEDEYLRMKDFYILNKEKMALAKEDMYVLHPLPRVNEISVEVDNDPRAAYFKQVQFGVYVRMALILTLLGLAPEKI